MLLLIIVLLISISLISWDMGVLLYNIKLKNTDVIKYIYDIYSNINPWKPNFKYYILELIVAIVYLFTYGYGYIVNNRLSHLYYLHRVLDKCIVVVGGNLLSIGSGKNYYILILIGFWILMIFLIEVSMKYHNEKHLEIK